jgi:hypothetical protein
VLCVVTLGALGRADYALRVVLQECGASECDHEATVMRALAHEGLLHHWGGGI